ncbi:LpxI family protein [Sporomusa sp.]|uniref:LpxI family protein n=1 Tax=Sporomusa sp. TaxID=2078658 RepID=UPI002C831098|nr:UDP-2,3-diacylglucosamine diphosphatase LpxI [Sporomusa sp.]HWR05909.1 UDP-2,3-diacylglucosamine diphosphatase LpxI [Sporomusa sp.]
MNTIGLIAGVGRLPVEFARAARGMGFAVIAIAVAPGVDSELAQVSNKYYTVGLGELDRLLALVKQEAVQKITMLGKVTKEHLFSGVARPDARMQKLLAGLNDLNDDTVMLALVREFAGEGIGVLDQTELIRQLMPAAGVLTQRQPTPEEQADMEFGLAMARQIGGLDIGQTVVVKNRAVLAVEAIEGTDACIRRGGQLGRGGAIVAKAAKPNQDMRFDVPSIGPDTLQAMIETGAVALVIEAGKTLVVDKQQVIACADNNGITIAAI